MSITIGGEFIDQTCSPPRPRHLSTNQAINTQLGITSDPLYLLHDV